MSVCFVSVCSSVLCWVTRCYSLALLVLSICFVSVYEMLFSCSFGLVVLSSLVSCWFARDVILLSLWLWRVCFIVLIVQCAVLAFDTE